MKIMLALVLALWMLYGGSEFHASQREGPAEETQENPGAEDAKGSGAAEEGGEVEEVKEGEEVEEEEPPRPPNVLLILVDDLGYGDLSSSGAEDLQTPHIDALVESGMRFNQFYANSTVGAPTRAALLTGRYPDLVGVPGNIRPEPERSWGYLNPEATLLPGLLQQAGYQTALIGKWHLGLESPNLPNERGFHLFRGFLADRMDDYFLHTRRGVNHMRFNAETIEPAGHATDLFTQWAIDYLMDRAEDDQPFFLLLAYNAPRAPAQPPPFHLERLAQRSGGLSEKRARLVALIEHLDEGIGMVMEALRENGQDSETLVLFTSDNGGDLRAEANCGDLRGGKREMYEGGIRVPLVVVWPEKIRPGTTSNRLALTMDLFPTICTVAGLTVESETDGVSLFRTLVGQMAPPIERTLHWVRREGGRLHQGQDYYAVRQGHWKLLQNSPFEPFKLFNVREDPLEEHDLAEQEPRVVSRLSRILRLRIQKAGAVPWQPGPPPPSESEVPSEPEAQSDSEASTILP
ncbi:MAG: sulfatase-like hydrolase/transferase [Acidobacteriota bacterium]|nr:sulfatase-like hydrolase/transferase [Acidobacteriota bacterium]